MALRRSPRTQAEDTEKAPDVIEILSDSEEEKEEAPEVEDEVPEPAPDNEEVDEQPLSRAAGIKYKIDQPEEPEEDEAGQDEQRTPSSAKLAVRAKDTGSAKHRHVSIEIPLPTSSELRRRRAEAEAPGSQENGEEVFKTPSERRHITFDDSEHDEFVTPREAPSRDPLETSIAQPGGNAEDKPGEEEEEEEEDSDDDAPPEAVSTRTAEAEALKVTEAERKAAQQ
jgi:hypothetical protein